jgi:hypothetical protein
LRRQTFETAIIERYRRRESSVEEALIEMYLAGISVRRVEDITEALWGTRVSPSTVSNLNKKIYAKIEAWRNRRIEGEHPYLYLDGIVMKRTWAGEVRNVSLLVASAVNSEGFREILGICEGAKEDKSGWSAFLRHLVDRGLKGVQLIISDACRGPDGKRRGVQVVDDGSRLPVLDSLEHMAHLADLGRWHVAEDIPVEMNTMQRCHRASGRYWNVCPCTLLGTAFANGEPSGASPAFPWRILTIESAAKHELADIDRPSGNVGRIELFQLSPNENSVSGRHWKRSQQHDQRSNQVGCAAISVYHQSDMETGMSAIKTRHVHGASAFGFTFGRLSRHF